MFNTGNGENDMDNHVDGADTLILILLIWMVSVECKPNLFQANPAAYKVTWLHNGLEVTTLSLKLCDIIW